MEKNSSKHFCILPWVHMHIWPNGITYPCCLATNDYVLGDTNKQSFADIWNSERMRELRRNILADAPTSGCKRCYEHEANGSVSMRQNMNRDFEHHTDRVALTHSDGSVEAVHMAYMDIRFSNICNMRCRTCGPELSSGWVDDAVKIGRYSDDAPKILRIKPTLAAFWDDVEPWIDSVERIYFAGGEPLIMDEHYKILEHLIAIGKTDIPIAYNTNFSRLTYKRHDVIQLWKRFSDVRVGASLDAMGDRAEYMRKGTVWSDICANRIRLKLEAPHVKFQISSTVSAYNALHCVDFYDEWISRGWVHPSEVDVNLLLFPEYQRVQVLPESVRLKARERILDYIERHDLASVDINGRSRNALKALAAALLNSEPGWEEFLSANSVVDGVRGEELFTAFPELNL
jgi:radical SAM protein with 4Fe4S-binding SPASM domain